jgi:hypothetical protein
MAAAWAGEPTAPLDGAEDRPASNLTRTYLVDVETKLLRNWRAELTGCGIVLGMAAVAGSELSAQVKANTPVIVYVREVRVDALLADAGVDTGALRRAVEILLAAKRLVSSAASDSTPAFDVAISVPRPVAGSAPEPRALVRFEVGRNFTEAGASDRLYWERSISLPEYPTWRALSVAVRQAVLEGVAAYVYGATGT